MKTRDPYMNVKRVIVNLRENGKSIRAIAQTLAAASHLECPVDKINHWWNKSHQTGSIRKNNNRKEDSKIIVTSATTSRWQEETDHNLQNYSGNARISELLARRKGRLGYKFKESTEISLYRLIRQITFTKVIERPKVGRAGVGSNHNPKHKLVYKDQCR